MGSRVAGYVPVAAAVMGAVVIWPRPARAWLFEEHANIGRWAVQALTEPQRKTLRALWSAARAGDPMSTRLCPEGPDDRRYLPTHNRTWPCVDFGALAAVAGDHSCNPADLWATITRSSWFPDVYADVARTERLIHQQGASDAQIVDAWHQGNLTLQRDDADYLARAEQNVAHFVLARGDEDTIQGFLERAAAIGTPLNATESYAAHHLAALAAAAKYAGSPDAREQGARAIEVLSDEAFALHFLEDAFSAGHFVGVSIASAEPSPERAGTHDYYCQHGLAGRAWGGQTAYAAHGDAFQTDPCVGSTAARKVDGDGVLLCDLAKDATPAGLTRSDLVVAGTAVAASLGQVLDVVGGKPLDVGVDPDDDALGKEDVCATAIVSAASATAVQRATTSLASVLDRTPQPYRDDVQLPHFRNEFGGFFLASGATRLGGALGGIVGPSPNTGVPRLQSALQVGVGVGIGAEGLTTRSTDGVFYLEGEFVAYGGDAFPEGTCPDPCPGAPTRMGWGVRAHLPFWVVPGDTVAGLLLWPIFPRAYVEMVLTAAQGSAIGHFERVHSGPYFSWELVLGREAGFYHSDSRAPFTMNEIELPILEVRSNHLFYERLGGDASVQIGSTLQWSSLGGSRVTFAPSLFARVAFDAIVYFVP